MRLGVRAPELQISNTNGRYAFFLLTAFYGFMDAAAACSQASRDFLEKSLYNLDIVEVLMPWIKEIKSPPLITDILNITVR